MPCICFSLDRPGFGVRNCCIGRDLETIGRGGVGLGDSSGDILMLSYNFLMFMSEPFDPVKL